MTDIPSTATPDFDPLSFVGVAHVGGDLACTTTVVGRDSALAARYADDSGIAPSSDRGFPDPTFDVAGRVCYGVDAEGRRTMARPDEALVVSSATPRLGYHRPVIDLDIPARLVPSTTPGHHHLYIDRDVRWEDYVKVLRALAAAGIVEQGYARAAEGRGASFARLPWVRKTAPSTATYGGPR